MSSRSCDPSLCILAKPPPRETWTRAAVGHPGGTSDREPQSRQVWLQSSAHVSPLPGGAAGASGPKLPAALHGRSDSRAPRDPASVRRAAE